MDNNEIDFIEYTGQPREGDYVYVHTYPSPKDESEQISMVHAARWVDSLPDASKGGVIYSKLLEIQPCTHEDALKIAVDHATEHGISKIYVQKDI